MFYVRDTWHHVGNYLSTQDSTGFAPQRLKRIFFQESRSGSFVLMKCKRLGYNFASSRHLSRSSNDTCNNRLSGFGQAMDKQAQTL